MRYVFDHCRACAENDDGEGENAPGVGCPSDGPADGCEAVWLEEAADITPEQWASIPVDADRETRFSCACGLALVPTSPTLNSLASARRRTGPQPFEGTS